MSTEPSFPVFPPIHIYTLLAAAVAYLTVCIGNKLYQSEPKWIKRMIPLYPLVLAIFHIAVIMLHGQGWLEKWGIAFDPEYHLHIHAILLFIFGFFGFLMYNEYLAKASREKSKPTASSDR